MKRCRKCQRLLTLTEFAKWALNKDGLSSRCRLCKSKYDKPRVQRAVRAHKMFLCNYLHTHPCVDCGEDDVVVLEFDHVRGKKYRTVSSMVFASREKVLEEIAKCEVRCSNCHTRITAQRADRQGCDSVKGNNGSD